MLYLARTQKLFENAMIPTLMHSKLIKLYTEFNIIKKKNENNYE